MKSNSSKNDIGYPPGGTSMQLLNLVTSAIASTPSGCSLSGYWTRAMASTHSTPSSGIYTIAQATAGGIWTVTTKDEQWSPGSGYVIPNSAATYVNLTVHGNITGMTTNHFHGVVEGATCGRIYWDDGSVWCRGSKPGSKDCSVEPSGGYPDPQGITKVYIVFSNHLDIGYTDNINGSCAGAVTNRYFHDHFPNAINTSAMFRAVAKTNKNRRYRWMTQSWLVSVFRNCASSKININGPASPSDLICPNATALAAFEAAAKAGDIGWHAFPHNAEPETLPASIFDAGLNITFEQDDFIGHAHRMTLSQRDVPGMTRAVIPLLTKRGVKAVSVGENNAVAPPNVPNAFVWRDAPSGESVLALFHPKGYGRRRRRRRRLDGSYYPSENDEPDDGASIIVNNDGSVHIDREKDCTTVPFSGVAICYAWNHDNQGPHTFTSANAIFDAAEKIFPQAVAVASDAFDDFVTDVQPFLHHLPVVEREIGDTWIYGASSDPLKVAKARAAYRAREACVNAGACDAKSEPHLRDFDRLLIKISEHTWGWKGGSMMKPVNRRTGGSYNNTMLEHNIATNPDYINGMKAWVEQRAFLDNAVSALGKASGLAAAIKKEWASMEPTPFPSAGYAKASSLSQTFVVDGAIEIAFGASGAITTLTEKQSGRQWADAKHHSIGKVWYQGISNVTLDDFNTNYTVEPHAYVAYTKPLLDLPAIDAVAKLMQLRYKKTATLTGETYEFLLDLSFDAVAHETRGAPASATAHVVVAHTTLSAVERRRRRLVEAASESSSSYPTPKTQIAYTLQLRNKTRCMAPEALWFSSNPITNIAKGAWSGDMMGSWIGVGESNLTGQNFDAGDSCSSALYPNEKQCGVHLHAVGERGVAYREGGANNPRRGIPQMTLAAPDSMLVSFLASPLPIPTPIVTPPEDGQGVHFSLVNNLWNTNYPYFYPFTDDEASTSGRYRFNIALA